MGDWLANAKLDCDLAGVDVENADMGWEVVIDFLFEDGIDSKSSEHLYRKNEEIHFSDA